MPRLRGIFNILVVDDSKTNRLLMNAMLSKMGYQVRLAEEGLDALRLCEQSLPDLVLMDVSMPGMSGFEVVQELRSRYETWFPILFLSANTGIQEVVEGLRAGGDDYLFKPVNYEILQAKIKIFQDRFLMSELMREQNQLLLDYRNHIEDEEDAAREFIQQFTSLNKIDEPSVRFFLKSAVNFSGDMIAVARKPNGGLHVLLADSAGHGLTAALAVMPITQPFYQMTAKGFELPAIVTEINRRVRDYLPLPRFVAAAIISFQPDSGVIQVWNGGCPSVLLLSADGTEVLHRFTSRHLPLGVVSVAEFDTGLEYYSLAGQSGQLLLCSDGATELDLGDGASAGYSGLLAAANGIQNKPLFDSLVETIENRLDGKQPTDDIALMIVTCTPSLHDVRQKIAPIFWQNRMSIKSVKSCGQPCGQAEWEFSLTLTSQQLKTLDVVPFLLNLTRQMEGDAADGKLFMVLSELFNNALDHGVLKLDSSWKNQLDGMDLYFSERATRLAKLMQGSIEMRLEKRNCAACACLKIRIKDSGDGFDYATSLAGNPQENNQYHGRGITLLNNMCSELRYIGNGSEVTAYLDFKNS